MDGDAWAGCPCHGSYSRNAGEPVISTEQCEAFVEKLTAIRVSDTAAGVAVWFRVGVHRERVQAFGDLDRAMARGEDVQGEGMPAHRNLDVVVHAVEVLDARGEERLGGFRIRDLCPASAGKGQSLGRVLVHELLLGVGEERPGMREDRHP